MKIESWSNRGRIVAGPLSPAPFSKGMSVSCGPATNIGLTDVIGDSDQLCTFPYCGHVHIICHMSAGEGVLPPYHFGKACLQIPSQGSPEREGGWSMMLLQSTPLCKIRPGSRKPRRASGDPSDPMRDFPG